MYAKAEGIKPDTTIEEFLAINKAVSVAFKVVGGVLSRVLGSEAIVITAKETGASSSFQGDQLNQYLRQLEKYGAAGSRELENGTIRFYGEITPARTSGEMIGARLVREWNPSTNGTRTWYETLDNAGTVRSVAPKPVTEPLNHRIFDVNGNYIRRR